MKELEAKFELLFNKLRVTNSIDIVKRTIKPVVVKEEIKRELVGL
jgi:hypothetical protein